MRKAIEWFVAGVGVFMMFGPNISAFIGFAIAVILWEVGEHILLSRA